MDHWKTLREQAGLTLAELAKRSGYSIGTINGLELHGEGSERLKKKLRDVLNPPPQIADSVKPALALLTDQAEVLTPEQWKQRAIQAEERLELLQSNVRAALRLSEAPVNSPSAGYRIVKKIVEDARESARATK